MIYRKHTLKSCSGVICHLDYFSPLVLLILLVSEWWSWYRRCGGDCSLSLGGIADMLSSVQATLWWIG